jgi:ABC-type Na+ efflux pump permease subunit
VNPTWLIATREFTERLRSRAFLISNGAILALIVLSLALPLLFGDDEATPVGTSAPTQRSSVGSPSRSRTPSTPRSS